MAGLMMRRCWSDGDELLRLARRHDSCILLANAPRAMVTVKEDG